MLPIDLSITRADAAAHQRTGSPCAAVEGRGLIQPERVSALRRVATIESMGSSTRIEGAKLTDAEVGRV